MKNRCKHCGAEIWWDEPWGVWLGDSWCKNGDLHTPFTKKEIIEKFYDKLSKLRSHTP